MGDVARVKQVPERFREDLEAKYEKLVKMLDGALEAKKKVRAQRHCPKPGCRCQHIEYVEVDDVDAAIKAGRFLAEYGVGRPVAAEGERESAPSFVRKVIFEKGEK